MAVNIAQVLRQGALRHGRRVAVVDVPDATPGSRSAWTYAALDAAACSVAGRLVAHGVRGGDRVGLIGDNSAGFLAAWFGIVYAGATVVPIPGRSVARGVRMRLSDAACRVVLSDAAHRAVAAEGAAPGAAGEVVVLDLEGGADTAPPLSGPRATEPGAAALILYTSGTTGAARGAVISHASMLLHTAALVHHTLGLGPDDTVLGVLPLTHSFGLRMAALAVLYAGARCVLLPSFDAAWSLRVAAAEGVTWLPAVPTMFARWAALPGPAEGAAGVSALPDLRWCLSAGAPLPEAVALGAAARLGADVRQGYGMTEATFSTVDAPPAPRRPGSVGPPVWGVEVAVVDAEGRPVPAGVDGEIRVRGQHVMTGYLGASEATAATVVDGWVRTGDVGRLDPDGALRVVDRTKDLIIRGGFNVYPSEVEAVLQEHPSVAAVAVVGRPSDDLGEAIVAFVVLAQPAQDPSAQRRELLDFAGANLSRPKVPDELHFLAELPLGPSAKVLRRVLRRLAASEESQSG